MIPCRKCGRILRNPESIRLGIGPVCLAREGGGEEEMSTYLPPKFHGFIMPDDLKAMNTSRSYVGERGISGVTVYVMEDGKQRLLRHIMYHSLDGFEWGYGGSGPADLARSILFDFAGIKAADCFYQGFKWEFIAEQLREGFVITGDDIHRWLIMLEKGGR